MQLMFAQWQCECSIIVGSIHWQDCCCWSSAFQWCWCSPGEVCQLAPPFWRAHRPLTQMTWPLLLSLHHFLQYHNRYAYRYKVVPWPWHTTVHGQHNNTNGISKMVTLQHLALGETGTVFPQQKTCRESEACGNYQLKRYKHATTSYTYMCNTCQVYLWLPCSLPNWQQCSYGSSYHNHAGMYCMLHRLWTVTGTHSLRLSWSAQLLCPHDLHHDCSARHIWFSSCVSPDACSKQLSEMIVLATDVQYVLGCTATTQDKHWQSDTSFCIYFCVYKYKCRCVHLPPCAPLTLLHSSWPTFWYGSSKHTRTQRWRGTPHQR